jgi:hypothetical protein
MQLPCKLTFATQIRPVTLEKSGGAYGTRTRNLRRDRAAL